MRVAVFGAGYAGLTVARRLERSLPDDVDLLVVDEDGTHLLQHELHRVIRRPSLASVLRIDLGGVLERARLRTARVDDVDPDAGEARLAGGDVVSYEVGAVCLGAETAYYDLPGVRDRATPLKRVSDAERIRKRFRNVVDRDGRTVVGGAGLSGVQVAGELAALAAEEDADPTVTLLEQRDAVAPTFPERFGAAVRDTLEENGVEVRTGATVARATDDAVVLVDGTAVDYDQFVWTGGIRGPSALGGERRRVRSTLRLAGDTFVVGDAARVVDEDGEAVPASAQAAVREARTAAANVCRLVEHRRNGAGGFEPRLDSMAFDSRGWIVSVGDDAVAQVGPTVLTGRAARALKTTVGAQYLTSVGAARRALSLVEEAVGE